MASHPALHQRPDGLQDELHLRAEEIQVLQLAPEVRRMVVSRDAGGGLRDWFLLCETGHAPWCSLPFLEHDTALYGTCEACRELHEGAARLARVRR